MTWTDASIEAMRFGFNAYRDEHGEMKPLVQRYASQPGDWMLEGGRIVSTQAPPTHSYRLVRMMPAPPVLDPLETIALESATRPA